MSNDSPSFEVNFGIKKMIRIHYVSGITIAIFVAIHLFNHIFSLFGERAHIEMMNDLRILYRNVVVESLLLFAVGVQIVSGMKLFVKKRKTATTFFDRLQLWSGLYLAFFLIFHLSAVLAGRFILSLDTNLYFGVAGLNIFPFNVFFIPYYAVAITSFFAHISAVHSKKAKRKVIGLEPDKQSTIILVFGMALTLVIIYGLTNGFRGVEIPEEYGVMIGK